MDFFEFSGGSGSGCTRFAHFLITLEKKVNELRKGSSYFEGAKLKKSEIQDRKEIRYQDKQIERCHGRIKQRPAAIGLKLRSIEKFLQNRMFQSN